MVQGESPARSRTLAVLTIAAALMFAVTLAMTLFYAPTEAVQGDVQRVFYLHLGAFIGGSLAFLIAAIASIVYLIRRNDKWDTLALASIEVGLVLTGFNIVSGMIWARPIWNTWWTWDPRLTSAAIMWMAYASYLMLRNAFEDPDRRGRFAAVYAIIAFSSVIYTTVITRLKPDTIHPVVAGPSPQNAQGSFGLADPRMVTTLMVSMLSFTVMAITLIWHRIRLQSLAQRVMMLKMKYLTR